MFYGREKELKKLNTLWKSNSFQMPIIYGRRRVGKTYLINEFCKDKETIFFCATQNTAESNLIKLSQAVNTFHNNIQATYDSFEKLFEAVANLAKDKQLILVIDEYPYLAKSFPAISSILQYFIDHYFKETKLFLILCGSSMSFMEKQVLNYESPLYGRRTAQMKILPFDYFSTALMFPNYTLEEKALAYGITGGVPMYASILSKYSSLKEALLNEMFDNDGYLFQEPSTILQMELREPDNYNAIIESIANGASKASDISSKCHIDSNICTKYLSKLIELGILKKEMPVGSQNKKAVIYQIADPIFRFWYRFVYRNMSSILTQRIEMFYESEIEKYYHEYMGLVFEDMCKDYLVYHSNYVQFPLGDIGQWWGVQRIDGQNIALQIDIVITSVDGKQCVVGECKYTNALVSLDVLEDLIKESEFAYPYTELQFYVFSLSGFTKQASEFAKDKSITLITLKDLYD